jgi:transposase
MPIGAPIGLTECHRFFAEPKSPRQRQYEALRAFFLQGLASAQVARQFGYTPAAFRMLCYDFRRGRLPEFFAATRPGPREQPKKNKARDQVLVLRKRNYSIYDISRSLKERGISLGPTAVREILAEEGFARLPRRLDEERPASIGPTAEAVADVRSFVLAPREFTTRVGGLFLFLPDLIRLDCDRLARNAKLPGSRIAQEELSGRIFLADHIALRPQKRASPWSATSAIMWLLRSMDHSLRASDARSAC